MRVAIIGAGFGGIAAAIALRRELDDVFLLDRARRARRHVAAQRLPGRGVRRPEPPVLVLVRAAPHWPRLCSPRDEILAYIRDVAAKYGIDRPSRPTPRSRRADWDDHWTLTAHGRSHVGRRRADRRHRPAPPHAHARTCPARRPSRATRSTPPSGTTTTTSTGKRVAVIGTGASAVQFVPEIAPKAAAARRLPAHGQLVPAAQEPPVPARREGRHPARPRPPGLPPLVRLPLRRDAHAPASATRARSAGSATPAPPRSCAGSSATTHELRETVWPDYTFGCKRVLFSSHFLPALARDERRRSSPTRSPSVTADRRQRPRGRLHHLRDRLQGDRLHAPDARSRRAGAASTTRGRDGPFAHLGITVPGLPVAVPDVRPEHEHQRRLDPRLPRGPGGLHPPGARGAASSRSAPEVAAASDRELQARFNGTAWTRCDSWYRDDATAASSPTGRATCASTRSARGRFDPVRVHRARERLARRACRVADVRVKRDRARGRLRAASRSACRSSPRSVPETSRRAPTRRRAASSVEPVPVT